jgi:hypothetical protein
MSIATITLHLPAYRTRALDLQPHEPLAEETYDRYVGEYVDWLASEAKGHDLRVATSEHADHGPWSIEAPSPDAKKTAHDWLHEQPDIWNWIP